MADVLRLIALAIALLTFSCVSQAVEEDCTVRVVGPNPPTQSPYMYKAVAGTMGTCSANSGGSLSSSTEYATLAGIQAAMTANTTMCGGSGCTLSSLAFCGTNGSGFDHYDQRLLTIPGGSPKHQNFQIQGDATDGTTCEDPEASDCAALGGKYQSGVTTGRAVTFAEAFPEEFTCQNNCKIQFDIAGPGLDKEADGTFSWVSVGQWTGETCGEPEEPPPPSPVPETDPRENGEWCETSVEGHEYCFQPDSNNCGYFDDDYVCLDAIGDDECWVDPDGSRLCADSAPSPPVPDNGTPGVPATPEDTIAHGGEETEEYDHFTPEQGAGSARDPGDSGANPANPDSGSPAGGTGSGPGGGGSGGTGVDPTADDSASGGATCDTAPVCDGDPIQCAVLQQQWQARCVEEPTAGELVEEIGFSDEELGVGGGTEVEIGELDAEGPLGGSSCPAPLSITVMGQTISIDAWAPACDFATMFAPFVLVMGYLIGGLMLVRGVQ